MRVVIGIPARLGSSRFPGKPLCRIAGLSMIEHCYKRSEMSKYATNMFVATPDQEIVTAVEAFGGKAIMTPNDVARPGLRVAVAAESLELDDEDIVVVVQGDEPLVHPEMIDLALKPLLEEDVLISNLCCEASEKDLLDPAEVKVVCDLQMNAMYMSRAPIPSVFHEEERCVWWRQVCIMPFKWKFMKRFNVEMKPTPLELQESIEMIRAIQNGYKVRMVPSPFLSKSVDTPIDRDIVEDLMLKDQLFATYGKKQDV